LINSDSGSTFQSYGVRSFCTFNGTNGSIAGSGNVSSITRHGTGDYTCNFSNAMPNSNYAVAGSMVGQTDNGSTHSQFIGAHANQNGRKNTTGFRFGFVHNGGAAQDFNVSTVAAFL